VDKFGEYFFITPVVDLQEDNSELKTAINLSVDRLRERWNKPKGQAMLIRWETNHFKRDVLNESVGNTIIIQI
jgi:hypothetical protein